MNFSLLMRQGSLSLSFRNSATLPCEGSERSRYRFIIVQMLVDRVGRWPWAQKQGL